jgi:hypothetical protein
MSKKINGRWVSRAANNAQALRMFLRGELRAFLSEWNVARPSTLDDMSTPWGREFGGCDDASVSQITAIRISFVVCCGLHRDERGTCGSRQRLWWIRRTLWESHRKRRARELFGHDCGASYIAAWHAGEGLSPRLCCCSDQRWRTICAGQAHRFDTSCCPRNWARSDRLRFS